jgi:hypothetical protein
MNALSLQGAAIQGAIDEACTLNPDPGSALESAAAAAGERLRTAGLVARPARDPDGMLGRVLGGVGAEPFYKAAPAWVGYSFRPCALPSAGRGYASGPALAQPSDEYAFLDDKSLSIEDKLFKFMALTLKKGDQELVDKMNEYKKKKSGGGFLGDIFGAIGDVLTDAVKTLGGPAVGSALAAIGMPVLAPVAMKIASDVASQALTRAFGESGSDSGGEDEKLQMLELQRLVDKQNTMFSALSNVLKSSHEAQMTAVGNIG